MCIRDRLRHVDLDHTDLSNANLSNAILQFANLNGGDLTSANLTNANLENVSLYPPGNIDNSVGVTTNYANVRGANLRGMDPNLSLAAMSMEADTSTICPNGRPWGIGNGGNCWF